MYHDQHSKLFFINASLLDIKNNVVHNSWNISLSNNGVEMNKKKKS
jgi:hypothetical protein